MISAVIFDLDGTVIDSEDVWGQAFTAVLKKLGVETQDEHPQTAGVYLDTNWGMLRDKFDIKTDYSNEQLSALTYQEYVKNISSVRLKTGFENFAQGLKDSGILVALATSTDWWVVEKIFAAIPIENYFDTITTGEEVVNKKPAPDIFWLAAEKLGVKMQDCLVIEDTQSGAEAALAAGMQILMVGRDFDNFDELTPQKLMVLLPKYAEKN